MPENENPAGLDARGHSGYSPMVLKVYDVWVHRFNNRLLWKCPTRSLVALYNEHITANHLEVGLGTGYLLDRCVMPSRNPRLVFCDMNPNCLHMASGRLRRYAPATFRRNVLEPMDGLGARFQSAGLNYVLHCLPGDLQSKRAALEHIKAWLEPGGILFGSTILARVVLFSQKACFCGIHLQPVSRGNVRLIAEKMRSEVSRGRRLPADGRIPIAWMQEEGTAQAMVEMWETATALLATASPRDKMN